MSTRMSQEADEILQQAFAHRAAGRLDEAIDCYERGIAMGARSAPALSNLGEALNEAERSGEAVAPLREAVALEPRFAAAWSNLGVAMLRQGNLDEAIRAIERAVALEPDNARLHVDLGLALLTRGDWARGFDEVEWRHRAGPIEGVETEFVSIPQWTGGSIRGKTLLLHTEQGLGDSILFARYVPLLAQSDAKIVLSCEPTLRRLFDSIPDVDARRVTGEPIPPIDLRCSLPSLPRIFESRPTRVPDTIPYLYAPFESVARWKSELASDTNLRVGICWSGRMTQAAHRFRRIPPALLAPLADFGELSRAASRTITFYNLQKDASSEDLNATQLNLIDHTPSLHDLAETAALMMNLDLIISSDTVIPHLAAAIGRPTWTLLPFNADWRWMRGGATTPWFPTMRLFRQSAPGQWEPVINEVAAQLRKFKK